MHVFQLHLCAAKKHFSLHSWYLCIAQLFKIAFRCSFLLKMINHMACQYIKCMQSICWTDTVGWTEFSYPFGNAYSILEAPCVAPFRVKFNIIPSKILSSTPCCMKTSSPFSPIKTSSKMARFWSKNQFFAAQFSPMVFL